MQKLENIFKAYNFKKKYDIVEYIYKESKKRGADYIKRNLSLLVENCKEYGTDILGIQDKLYKFHYKDWTELLKKIPDKTKYLDHIIVELTLDIIDKA